jgi:phosphatidylglycerophosphatase C
LVKGAVFSQIRGLLQGVAAVATLKRWRCVRPLDHGGPKALWEVMSTAPVIQVCGPIVAFDVDGTLTWTDSFTLFLRFIAGRKGFFVGLLRLMPTLLGYRLGILSRDRAKNLVLSAFLKGLSAARYQECCDDYARVAYPIIARADAIMRLNRHLGEEAEVVLVSASLEGYLSIWSKALNVTHVLATKVEIEDAKLTGMMAGPNCRGEEKLARIKAHFGDAPLVAAYGDTRGDDAMLAASQNPGLRVFKCAPANRIAILWDLYCGDLLERRLRGDNS